MVVAAVLDDDFTTLITIPVLTSTLFPSLLIIYPLVPANDVPSKYVMPSDVSSLVLLLESLELLLLLLLLLLLDEEPNAVDDEEAAAAIDLEDEEEELIEGFALTVRLKVYMENCC